MKGNKIISITLSVLLLFSVIPITTMTASAETTLCSVCGIEFINGFCDCENGYESATLNSDGFYELSNAGQLCWFREQVNGGNVEINAILTNDIDINPDYVFNTDGTVTYNGETVTEGWHSWEAIGNSTNKYNGVFNGNGKTVSGLYFNGEITDHFGMFGIADANAEIKNLGLVNSYLYSSTTGTYFFGGIIGQNYGKLSNCQNSSTVTSTNYVGGIAGVNATNALIIDCSNYGVITALSLCVGGIVGYTYSTVKNCYNAGTIFGKSSHVGGITGYVNNCEVSFCNNSGIIQNNAVNYTSIVGGICGYNQAGEINQCYNTATMNNIKCTWFAGVVGYNDGGTVKYCYNTGEITGRNSLGGIVGMNYGKLSICYNTANIICQESCAGGIVGNGGKNETVIQNCYNSGDIYCIRNFTGGILGYDESWAEDEPLSLIENCYNIGNVSNGYNKNLGSIVGNTSKVIENCYYLSETDSKTKEQFGSGEVTYLLNGSVSDINNIWRQEIGVDPYPVFDSSIVFYDGTNYYNINTILSPMSSQIKFRRNADGSYANKFDVRTRVQITDEDFRLFVGGTNEEASKNIKKVGFVYSISPETFSIEDAETVAKGGEVAGYTDAPVKQIQDADGYYMFTCLVTDIPSTDTNYTLVSYAYICVEIDGVEKWYFMDTQAEADFNSLYTTYYPVACEKYGWE